MNGQLGDGWGTAFIVAMMAAAVLAVIRPDLSAGAVRRVADPLAGPAR
ncbi:hypothetical protein ACFQ7F_07505 [Streptomyces sp. NPDC056486]